MYPGAKRFIHILGAGLGLILLSPFIGICSNYYMDQIGYPVIFHQMRPGLNGQKSGYKIHQKHD